MYKKGLLLICLISAIHLATQAQPLVQDIEPGVLSSSPFLYGSLNNGVISTIGGATISLRAISNASAAWGDLDLDGDLDLLVSGYGRNPYKEYTKFYRNNGNGNFTDMYYNSYTNEKISGPILTDVKYGSVAIVDINNDNAPDVLLVGEAGYASFSKTQNTCVHLNNGNGKFSQNFINDFEQVQNGYIGAEDFDNDGDKEIVVIGESATGPVSRIYINKIINGVNCFNINQPLNITQVPNVEPLIVFPNPAKENICIKSVGSLLGKKYSIFDQVGRLVATGLLISDNMIIPINNLSSGVYLIKIDGVYKQAIKIVKE